MHFVSLPETRQSIAPVFSDVNSARAWLATQPQAQSAHMLAALTLQIEAIDATAEQPAVVAIALLNVLRSAAIPSLEAVEPRFTRKAIPLPAEDERNFELAQQFWTRLGIAYLRRAPDLPSSEQALPLNRAACAFRLAEYCYFQAARECPAFLDQLLFAVLDQATQSDVLNQALPDPDFPHLGKANIAGHLVWAFLLRLLDPYRLSASQLVVANRAISRWRELCTFQVSGDDDPKSRLVDLNRLAAQPLPKSVPRWLDVRSLVRKSRQRLEALKAGESPEALKLGRELSAAACIRLLGALNASLRLPQPPASTEVGEIELSFGCENAYAVIRGESLNPTAGLDAKSASLAHRRMAMFGFDRLSQMPTAVKALNVPGEIWSLVDGKAVRPAGQAAARRLSPCLIASRRRGTPQLGVMLGLQSTAAGTLAANLLWFEGIIETGWMKQGEARMPAFLLRDAAELSLIVPAGAGLRINQPCTLEDSPIKHLLPTEVLERGMDFVLYACRPA
ncbi:MAG: hypothetical protein U0989_15845 [Azonexus sp.]|nr:hypothetical protein [Azonexus sp.]MDZ4316225.1 hypothetical protein [Azonexus sp.]